MVLYMVKNEKQLCWHTCLSHSNCNVNYSCSSGNNAPSIKVCRYVNIIRDVIEL